MTCTRGMGCVDDDRKERKRGQKTNGYEDWLCLQYYYWLCYSTTTGCVYSTTTGCVCSAIALLMKRV